MRVVRWTGMMGGCFGVLFLAVTMVWADAWKFGVMGDTQWKSNLDGENPNTVPVGIIKQINREMINQGVEMVVQVGDLVDSYSSAAFDTRSAAAQELIDAGIAFFPLRGNHEAPSSAANYLSTAFPQACGYMNTFGAVNFQYPSEPLECLTYSFDFNNVRFVMVDQFTRKDNSGSNNNNNIIDQIPWISSVLSGRESGMHAFVFAHKNLIGQNHVDVIFGSSPASNISAQNSLIKTMADNGVGYYLGGHDHVHHRSIVTSPDRASIVEQLICASESYKFYTPARPSNDARYNSPTRELPVSQELYTIGYYVFTVDGPMVTVDYYASLNGCGGTWGAGVDCGLSRTPSLSFEKRETCGYSLNGKKFIIAPNDPFTVVADTCRISGSENTVAAIIDGENATSAQLYDGRTTVQDITTGWRSRSDVSGNLRSDEFHLWGMANEIGSEEGDWYTLELSYNGELDGPLCLGMKDGGGNWVKACDMNFGGFKKFIIGKYKAEFGPGTYGIDPETKKVWASVNRGGIFALIPGSDGDLDNDGDVDNDDVRIISSLKNKPADVMPAADLDNDGKITVLDARKLVLIKNK